ncbi:aminopeptidase P family protein [bacterium]|nr:aminopeptidase P family protein [bacterium]
MFASDCYIKRRELLKKEMQSGILLFLGNNESPMNYPNNTYPFRQDSSFLYFWGLDTPDLAAVIDLDKDQEIIYGTDATVDDIIWTGPQETLSAKAQKAGIKHTALTDQLKKKIEHAIQRGQKVHHLPQYRQDNIIHIAQLMGIETSEVNKTASQKLIKAVISQRSVKSDKEIEQIEMALDISYKMYKTAMKLSKPGITENKIAGIIDGLVLSSGAQISFQTIFSIHGETLHNHSHENVMREGDLLRLDSGAESPQHYASDITRTFPVNGKFTTIQKEIYHIVLAAQEKAIHMMRPDIPFRDVHIHACTVMADGLKQLGLIKGNVDDAVSAGIHALFFPHGLGHMLGLDVHDMEGLDEENVGYDNEIKRSDQFGLAYLRFGKKLKPGFVLTVEPGIYFIPELINQWKLQKKHTDFLNYDKIEKYRHFGGIRIEDDILITENGHRILGKKIAKTIEDVETWCPR